MASRRESAGLLLYRHAQDRSLEVLLAHPGGPFFARKDEGAWSIPKGELEDGEDPLACARREFAEETGLQLAPGGELALGAIEQRGGKRVHGFALCGDCDPAALRSNDFELEWPPKSGKRMNFPEIDRFAFFSIAAARAKLNPAQVSFLDRLCRQLEAP